MTLYTRAILKCLFSIPARLRFFLRLYFLQMLTSLIFIIWEAALPPTICAIIALITYVTMYQTSYWDLFFFCLLGQQYVIALFITV